MGDAEQFQVWCVLRKDRLVRYDSGPRDDQWSTIYGMYRSEDEARVGAVEMAANPPPILWQATPPFYDTPIAWLVTFIILGHEAGDAKYHVEPCYGGQIGWNDDRDVMAIYPTRVLAEAFAASKGFPNS